MTVVLATHNQGKLAELRRLCADLPVSVVSVGEVLPSMTPVEETGATFEENAVLKARAVSRATHLVALADDSGLEVDALGGRPGVRSARFAREGATDAENNAALLSALQDVEDNQRQARFRCVMALVDPFGADQPITTEGRCEGRILASSRGAGGFGYDPLFLVEGLDKTLAELGEGAKNEISHRGKALRAMRDSIEALARARTREAELLMTGRAEGTS
jgi:XTP/dITP diphosphohydrolase